MDDAQWKVGPLPLLLILKSAPVVPGLEGFFFLFFLPFNFPDSNVQFGWSQETDHTPQRANTHTQDY